MTTTDDARNNPRGVAIIGDPGRAAIAVPEGLPPTEAWPPDIAASEYAVGGITIRAASLRGVQHRHQRPGHQSAPRQDAFGIGSSADRRVIVAMVCDGVGDLDYSHEAANHVCNSLPWKILQGLGWQDAIFEVNNELVAMANSRKGDVAVGKGTMATTMMSATISYEASGYNVHLAWVGDSEAWSLDDNGAWVKLAPVEGRRLDTGITTGRTSALPSSAPTLTERDIFLTSGRIILMSDGVGTPLMMNTDIQETLGEWWKSPPNPFMFAAQVGFARMSFMDDRTAVGIWLTEAEKVGEETPYQDASAPADSSQNSTTEASQCLRP